MERGLLEILQKSSPEITISPEVLGEINNYVRNFVGEIGKGLSQICEENNKDVVDLDDFKSLIDNLKDGNEKGKFKFSENVPLPSKYFLQMAETSNQSQTPYKRNGHSTFVKNWISENDKARLLVAVFPTASILKRIIDCIKDNCGQAEINFDCDRNMMQTQALGNLNVSVFHLELLSSGFDFYSCDDNLTIGISLSGLLGFLKQSSKGDQLTILYANGCKECVFVLEDGVRTSVFEMRLKVMEKPSFLLSEEMNYPSEYLISSIIFQRICKDFKVSVTDVDIIITETGNLSFVGSGHYGRIQMACDTGVELVKFSPCTISFSSAYLANFSKACLLSSMVKIRLGTGLPLMATFDIPNFGSVKYFLAYRQV